MAKNINKLEEKLNDLFVKKAPPLPAGGKKFLVAFAPVIAIIIGVLSLFSAWTLWTWANAATGLLNYASAYCNAYSGTCAAPVTRLTLWLWLGVIVLAAEGLMYVFAFSGLKAQKKKGWNYLFYGSLLSVVYAVVSLFNAYNVFSQFVGALIGAAIGLYLLFQIRESYLGKTKSAPKRSSSK